MNQKGYMDIQRLKNTFEDAFHENDYIVIQEKIDGANFSIRYDKETNTLKSFSRKTELSFQNNLRGAWNWVQTLDANRFKTILYDNLILFGEWLVPHTVKYPEDKYNKAYFFDIYDVQSGTYLPQDAVKEIVEMLDLTYVPVFYSGNFTTWENVKNFVGKTELGGDYGEGIVVKNQTMLNNPDNRMPFYVKIVCEEFSETKERKIKKIKSEDELKEEERIYNLAESVVTEARIRKILNKLIDEDIIPCNWDESNMNIIARNIGREVFYDCQKEESEIVSSIGQLFGKLASSISMNIVRKILRNER